MSSYQFKDFAGSSHTILLRLLRRHAPKGGRLLDLGASGGELGEAARSHFGDSIAFEFDLANLPRLRTRFDRAVICDLEQVTQLPSGCGAIVMADVLEHLRRPRPLLDLAPPALAPGGRIFVSLPNVANIAIRLSLLAGRFEYQDRGILDRTHLRFFTRATARRELEGAGLRIVEESVTAIPLRLAFPRVPRPLMAVAEAILLAVTAVLPTLFGYQFVFVTEPREGGGADPSR